jgi:hypothetical protein
MFEVFEMFEYDRKKHISSLVLTALLTAGLETLPLGAQSASSPGTPRTSPPYHPQRFARRAELHYGLVWGVDSLSVKTVESGEMIRFSYRVVNAEKAKMLNDKKFEPALIDPAARVSLVIPQLEKVGKLRQSSTPIEGRQYWMAFSNKGRRVKRGDRVTVVIGQFRAEGLVVD